MSEPQQPMISYSCNLEDVILQRALQHVPNGCYVDVGASNPLRDSNTAAFYKKGWRGICIEPQTEMNVNWSVYRPDDLLITALVGSQQGEATLYVYDDIPQISTCCVETVERWNEIQKSPDAEMVVPVFTLNQLLAQFLGERTIHLLCIDVEGAEKEVLDGFDLKKYCPWIIVIEAVVPGTQTPAYQHWEGDVLSAGYTMVYEDGFNRFYLSNTKLDLLPYFTTPPNGWDNFISYKQALAEENAIELEKNNELLQIEIQHLKQQLTQAVNLPLTFWNFVPRVDDARSQEKITQLEEANEKLNRQIKGLQQEAALKKFLSQ